jgi:Zn-dependent alcohol dehydrogenase
LGGIGLSAIQGARIAGAARIVASDPIAARRDLAQRLGATETIDPTREDVVGAVRDLTDGVGVDYAFEAAGIAALQSVGIEATRAGGTTVLVGAPPIEEALTIPNVLLWSITEKKLKGCFLGSTSSPRDIPRLLALWRSGRLDLEAMITQRLPLDDINAGFADLAEGAGIRTVIDL